jgi:transcriptional regulator with XRE-family HTH domain
MSYEDEDPKELGLTLMALRRGVGLTQEQLAGKCRVSPSTVARHEGGEDAPSVVILLRYCRELGLLESEFFEIHRGLRRARERLKEGPGWVKRVAKETPAHGPSVLDDPEAAQRFALGAAHMFEALLRGGKRP